MTSGNASLAEHVYRSARKTPFVWKRTVSEIFHLASTPGNAFHADSAVKAVRSFLRGKSIAASPAMLPGEKMKKNARGLPPEGPHIF